MKNNRRDPILSITCYVNNTNNKGYRYPYHTITMNKIYTLDNENTSWISKAGYETLKNTDMGECMDTRFDYIFKLGWGSKKSISTPSMNKNSWMLGNKWTGHI